MTPSRRGRMATMLPGVRPSIWRASSPTFSSLPVFLSMATTEGSLSTMPLPFTYTRTEAVPRSIPISFANVNIVTFHLVISVVLLLAKKLADTLKNHYTGRGRILQAITGTFSHKFSPFFGENTVPDANERGRNRESYFSAPARAAHTTLSAPASMRQRAQAAMVLPVVTTSSMSKNRRPRASSGWGTV